MFKPLLELDSKLNIDSLKPGCVVGCDEPGHQEVTIFGKTPEGKRILVNVETRGRHSQMAHVFISVSDTPASSNVDIFDGKQDLFAYHDMTGKIEGKPAENLLRSHLEIIKTALPDRDEAVSAIQLRKGNGHTSHLLVP